MGKNVLIIGATSELARDTINELKKKDYNVFVTSRSVNVIEENVQEYNLDVTKEEDFILLKEKFNNIKFDTIISFVGVAIASAVVELSEKELKKQLDINLFGLLKIIKYFSPNLQKDGKLINISSMAAYGIFPFLSPYCLSKASADILLNAFSVENNIKTVSIRPGCIATKFWDTAIKLNKNNMELSNNFKKEKEIMVQYANKFALKSMNSIYVAKKVAKIIDKKNPKSVYNIGIDSKATKLTRFFSNDFIKQIIKVFLRYRVEKN